MTTTSEYPTTIRTAVEDSIREDRIVHLTIEDLGSSYDPTIADLEAACEDSAVSAELEYWGQDEDGDKWRIHVERR